MLKSSTSMLDKVLFASVSTSEMRGSENASLRTAVRLEGGSTCKGLEQLLAQDEDSAGARMTGTFNVLELPWKCGNCPPPVSPLCQAHTICRAEVEALP